MYPVSSVQSQRPCMSCTSFVESKVSCNLWLLEKLFGFLNFLLVIITYQCGNVFISPRWPGNEVIKHTCGLVWYSIYTYPYLLYTPISPFVGSTYDILTLLPYQHCHSARGSMNYEAFPLELWDFLVFDENLDWKQWNKEQRLSHSFTFTQRSWNYCLGFLSSVFWSYQVCCILKDILRINKFLLANIGSPLT